MTISSSSVRNDYANTSGGSTFPYTFKIFAATDIRVVTTTEGVDSIKVMGVDYTVSGVGSDSGGNVAFHNAVPAGTGVHIVAVLDKTNSGTGVPLTQTTDLVNETSFFQDRIEDRLDILCRQLQTVVEEVGRQISAPISDPSSNLVLPDPSTRANLAIVFDSNGNIDVGGVPSVSSNSEGPWNSTPVRSTGSTVYRTLADRFSERCNVKDFGAIGDSVTDDQAAFQSAVDAAIAGGKSLFIPPGTYFISNPINILAEDGILVEGVSGQSTLLTGTTNSAIVIGDNASEQRHNYIRNIRIISAGANSQPAIVAYMLCRSAFEDVVIDPQEENGPYFPTGIQLVGVDYVKIEHCNIRAVSNGVLAQSKSDGTYAAGLFVTGGTKISEVSSGNGVRLLGGLGGVVFSDCDIVSCGQGVSIENTIGHTNREIFFGAGCTIDTCSTNGVIVLDNSCTHVLMTGTWFGTCSTAVYWDHASAIFQAVGCRVANTPSGGYGFRFQRAGGNATVSNCRLNGVSGAITAIDANAALSSFAVIGNTVQTWQWAVYLGSGISAYLVSGNTLTGISNGINVGTTPDGQSKAIRGNAGFTSANAGQTSIGAGTSSITVNHGLAGTPQVVTVTPAGDLGSSQRIWVDTLTSTQFTIRVSGTAPGGGVTFFWSAQVYPGE
jgi:hypothetical protein